MDRGPNCANKIEINIFQREKFCKKGWILSHRLCDAVPLRLKCNFKHVMRHDANSPTD